MKKGQILEGMVTRLDFPNKGIVETEEGLCQVKNVLPGQKIRFVVQKKRSGKAEGRLLEVLEKAPNEIESGCPVFSTIHPTPTPSTSSNSISIRCES